MNSVWINLCSCFRAGSVSSKANRILLPVTGRSGGMFCKNQKFTQPNQQSSIAIPNYVQGMTSSFHFAHYTYQRQWHFNGITQDRWSPLVDAVATVMRCSLGVNVQEKNRARLVLKALWKLCLDCIWQFKIWKLFFCFTSWKDWLRWMYFKHTSGEYRC